MDFIINISKEEFVRIKNKLNDLEHKEGGYSTTYFDNENAYKVYNQSPILKNNYGEIIFDDKNVLQNLKDLKEMTDGRIAKTKKLYVCDEKLVMYKSKRIKDLYNFSDININDMDVSLNDLKSSWNEALSLAKYLSSKNIVMYDLKEDNAFMKDGKFKICDLDFYKKESLDNLLNINYMLVNTLFIEFLERYLFFNNYTCREDDYLIETDKYVDDAIEELLLASNYRSKTLRDVSNNLG